MGVEPRQLVVVALVIALFQRQSQLVEEPGYVGDLLVGRLLTLQGVIESLLGVSYVLGRSRLSPVLEDARDVLNVVVALLAGADADSRFYPRRVVGFRESVYSLLVVS